MLSLNKQRPVKQSRALKLQTYIWGVMIIVLRVGGIFFASDVIKRSPSLPMILFTYLVLSASAFLFAIIERPKLNRVLAVHSRYQLFLNGGLRALSLYLIFCSLRHVSPSCAVAIEAASTKLVLVVIAMIISPGTVTATLACGAIMTLLGFVFLALANHPPHHIVALKDTARMSLWGAALMLAAGVLACAHTVHLRKLRAVSAGRLGNSIQTLCIGAAAVVSGPLAVLDALWWAVTHYSTGLPSSALEGLEEAIWFLVVVMFMAIFWVVARHYANQGVTRRLGNKKAQLFTLTVSVAMAMLVAFGKLVGDVDTTSVQIEMFAFREFTVLMMGGAMVWGGARLMFRQSAQPDTSPPSIYGAPDRMVRISRILGHILRSRESQRIFIFLVLNLGFTFVEFIVGFFSNSLGLISDAGHMLFDCVALGIGLFASYMATQRADAKFTYGYARAEVVSGFANAIVLVFIAVSIIIEALQRLREPPEVHSSHLLPVSVIGLIINIIGLMFFHEHHHGHSHAGGHAHDAHKDEEHGHSHGGHGDAKHGHKCQHHHHHHDVPSASADSNHKHDHQNHGRHDHHCDGHNHDVEAGTGKDKRQCDHHDHHHHHDHHDHDIESGSGGSVALVHDHHECSHSAHNSNMQAMFIHVLADALGSVSVILSALAIKYFQWYLVDPICAGLTSLLILASVAPLLRETSLQLLQAIPPHIAASVRRSLKKVVHLDGVVSAFDIHVWQLTGAVPIGTIRVQIQPEKISPQEALRSIKSIFSRTSGIKNMTIQIDCVSKDDGSSLLPDAMNAGFFSHVFKADPTRSSTHHSHNDMAAAKGSIATTSHGHCHGHAADKHKSSENHGHKHDHHNHGHKHDHHNHGHKHDHHNHGHKHDHHNHGHKHDHHNHGHKHDHHNHGHKHDHHNHGHKHDGVEGDNSKHSHNHHGHSHSHSHEKNHDQDKKHDHHDHSSSHHHSNTPQQPTPLHGLALNTSNAHSKPDDDRNRILHDNDLENHTEENL